MGNTLDTSDKNTYAYQVPNTGKFGVESPHYRNIRCLKENNGELISRQWEDVTTCHQAFMRVVREYPKNPCLGSRAILNNGKRGDYVWDSYKSVFGKVKNFGAGLKFIGAKEGDKIGIYSINRPEWIITHQACYAHSFVSVPLYDTLGPDALRHIISHSDIKIIVCSSDKLEKLSKISIKFPNLAWIIHMDDWDSDFGTSFQKVKVTSMKQLMSQGLQNPCDFTPPSPSTPASICYTSGVTGDPKGVMLSHSNLVAMVAGALSSGVSVLPTDVYISYLPLAHMYERFVVETLLASGAAIGFYGGEILNLLDDISTLQPTIFASVPRVLNKLQDRLMASIQVSGGFYQNMFDAAYSSKQTNLKTRSTTQSFFWDKVVFSKLKAKLGSKIRFILTGSAPLSPEVHEFFKLTMSVPVLQGYGLTETSAATTCQNANDNESGHVGPPLACCEVKLISVPEMEYLVSNNPPQGEVCVRGYNVFTGYYKQLDKTKEVIDEDGWFHTGDIGEIRSNGTMVIIDRMKNIFKLSQGIYVAVEKIENVLNRNPFIQQIYVHGESTQSVLVAIIVPNFDCIRQKIKAENNVDISKLTKEEICQLEDVKCLMLNEISKTSKQAELAGFEFIKNLHLEHEPFTQENGLLTPSYKLKRLNLLKHYKDVISTLYKEYMEPPKADSRHADPEVTEPVTCTVKSTDENKAPEAPIASSIEEDSKYLKVPYEGETVNVQISPDA